MLFSELRVFSVSIEAMQIKDKPGIFLVSKFNFFHPLLSILFVWQNLKNNFFEIFDTNNDKIFFTFSFNLCCLCCCWIRRLKIKKKN